MNVTPYWWYLRAFAVVRAGDKLTDSNWFLEPNGAAASEDRAAAVAVAALDAATGKGIRSQSELVAEVRKLVPLPQK